MSDQPDDPYRPTEADPLGQYLKDAMGRRLDLLKSDPEWRDPLRILAEEREWKLAKQIEDAKKLLKHFGYKVKKRKK